MQNHAEYPVITPVIFFLPQLTNMSQNIPYVWMTDIKSNMMTNVGDGHTHPGLVNLLSTPLPSFLTYIIITLSGIVVHSAG